MSYEMMKWLRTIFGVKESPQVLEVPEEPPSERDTIEWHRAKFKSAPIGLWSQAAGTFSAVMDQHWEFRADGSGSIIETGPFGGERGTTLFRWREVADFCVECKVTRWPYEDDEDFVADEGDEPEEWDTVAYSFKMVETDCGSIVALCQMTPSGNLDNRFWHSDAPLHKRSR